MREVQVTLPLKTLLRGRYLVEAVLSRGETGNVYLVRDKHVGGPELMTLKEIVHPTATARDRFSIEPEALKQLEHPALPRIYDAFVDDRLARSYVLMEYIAGSSARDLLSRQSGHRFGVQETMAMMAPILEAVAYLHQRQPPIIHRDIKPSNIIVAESARGPLLIDFGLAKQSDADATTSAVRFGTPGYCAPEQYGNQGTSPQTDIYALGATFYTLLTGSVPIESVTRVMQLCELKRDPLVPLGEQVPGLPAQIVVAIHRTLNLESADRFSSVEQFQEVLEPWLSDPGPPEMPKPAQVASRRGDPPGSAGSPSPEAMRADTTSSEAGSARISAEKPAGPRAHHQQRLPRGDRESPAFRPRFLVVVGLSMILILGIGLSLWWRQLPAPHSGSTTATNHPQSQSASSQGSGRLPSPSIPPRPPKTASPPAVHSYQGIMYDLAANTSAVMSLTDVRQERTTIRGTFSGFKWNGSFVGTVDGAGHMQFSVTSTSRGKTLSFDGAMHGDGTLAGSYCERTSDGGCSAYGPWSLVPDR
jgi:eukaryotic-like serine/threonine-protein kinase